MSFQFSDEMWLVSDGADWTSTGRLFQSRGPAAANADSNKSRRTDIKETGLMSNYFDHLLFCWWALKWCRNGLGTPANVMLCMNKVPQCDVFCPEKNALMWIHQTELRNVFQCPSAPVDVIWVMMIVRGIRGKIIRTVPCCIVSDSCAQWYAVAYEQFLKLSVGLGLVFVRLFSFTCSILRVFWAAFRTFLLRAASFVLI